MIVLALVTFLFLLIPALLGLALTGSKLAPELVRVDRGEQYQAVSALDAAILQAQQAYWMGSKDAAPGECPDQDIAVDDETTLTVECESQTGANCYDRTITFWVLESPDDDRANALASAVVMFGFREGVDPYVHVLSWSSERGHPVIPPQVEDCPPPEELDPLAAVPAWGTAEPVLSNGNTQWRLQAPLTVVDDDVPENVVAGAAVTVKVEIRRSGAWERDTDLTGTTNAQGEWLVQSALYPTGGSAPVEAVRFSVEGVVSGDLGWAFVPGRDETGEVSAPSVSTRASLAPLTRGFSGNQWTATGVVEVRDNTGGPLAGATVTLRVRSRTDAGWEVGPPLVSNPTSAGGTVTVSRGFKDNGKQEDRVKEVEYLIETVTSPGRSWTNSTWPGGELLRSITR